MYLYNVENVVPPILVMERPEYILPEDRFEVSCKGNRLVRAIVQNCLVLSESSQRGNGEFRVNLCIEHVNEACKVQCFSAGKVITKEISVIGM